MAKNGTLFLLGLVLPAFFLLSCSSHNENDDMNKPIVEKKEAPNYSFGLEWNDKRKKLGLTLLSESYASPYETVEGENDGIYFDFWLNPKHEKLMETQLPHHSEKRITYSEDYFCERDYFLSGKYYQARNPENWQDTTYYRLEELRIKYYYDLPEFPNLGKLNRTIGTSDKHWECRINTTGSREESLSLGKADSILQSWGIDRLNIEGSDTVGLN